MSRAKLRAPRTKLAPPVSITALSAAGLVSGKLVGASASNRFSARSARGARPAGRARRPRSGRRASGRRRDSPASGARKPGSRSRRGRRSGGRRAAARDVGGASATRARLGAEAPGAARHAARPQRQPAPSFTASVPGRKRSRVLRLASVSRMSSARATRSSCLRVSSAARRARSAVARRVRTAGSRGWLSCPGRHTLPWSKAAGRLASGRDGAGDSRSLMSAARRDLLPPYGVRSPAPPRRPRRAGGAGRCPSCGGRPR